MQNEVASRSTDPHAATEAILAFWHAWEKVRALPADELVAVCCVDEHGQEWKIERLLERLQIESVWKQREAAGCRAEMNKNSKR